MGKNVQIRLLGQLPFVLLSRSSMIIDTELNVNPGTLGGFPGGGSIGPADLNQNGPGSPGVVVHLMTLSTSATRIMEIQEVQTICPPGENIGGYFILSCDSSDAKDAQKTQPISYDASAYDVQLILQDACPDLGHLLVERPDTSQQNAKKGRVWQITFLSAARNAPLLQAFSLLEGIDAEVVTRCIREGNQIGGGYQLSFYGSKTRLVTHNASAESLRDILLDDLSLVDAEVSRTDPLNRCVKGSTTPDMNASASISPMPDTFYNPTEWLLPDQQPERDAQLNWIHKLCSSGRGAADGFVWKIRLYTTILDHSQPFSDATDQQQKPPCPLMVVNDTKLTGIGAIAQIINSKCFSMSFGGAGGSFGGNGGGGYIRRHPSLNGIVEQSYLSDEVEDLMGGSGGAAGGENPIDIIPVTQPVMGGSGGGSVYLGAVNDILLGDNARLLVNGGHGTEGYRAGGGGAGGLLVLSSAATVENHGIIESNGGNGGTDSSFPVSSYSGGGGSGGRVAMYAQAVSNWGTGSIEVAGGISGSNNRTGKYGSVYASSHSAQSMRVDPSLGAAGTKKSLLVQQGIDSPVTMHLKKNFGPRYIFFQAEKPTWISYFFRVGNIAEGAIESVKGAFFGLQESAEAQDFLIATAMENGKLTHGSNVISFPEESLNGAVQSDRWYKVDIRIAWFTKTYSISLNDVLKVSGASFHGESISTIQLYNYQVTSVWWDEIYVGNDHLMGFECPQLLDLKKDKQAGQESQEVMKAIAAPSRSLRKLWASELELKKQTFHEMVKHESHLSKRPFYQHEYGNLVSFDGEPYIAFTNDVYENSQISKDQVQQFVDANLDPISQSELTIIQKSVQDSTIVRPSDASEQGGFESSYDTAYWYSDVLFNTTDYARRKRLLGGIGSCSTKDYREWRNEGIVLDYKVLLDIYGQPTKEILFAERPNVVYNKMTHKFVMWMHVDVLNNTLGLEGVATSMYPNGPFSFERSFYPDGPVESPAGQIIRNMREQSIAVLDHQNANLKPPKAFLIRTYHKTIEYWLPRPVMDPLWQSVQTTSGEVDFGLSYHRAFYHSGYDDPHDLYLQRWRMEDQSWAYKCCASDDMQDCVIVSNSDSTHGEAEGCPVGRDLKTEILGQAQDSPSIQSRIKDPGDPANSIFQSESVTAHTTWGYRVYNTKTWRDNYLDALKTNISWHIFQRYWSRQKIETKTKALVKEDEDVVKMAIAVNNTHILDAMLGDLGVPLSLSMMAKYPSHDLAVIDPDSDGKITSNEVAAFYASSLDLPVSIYSELKKDFVALRAQHLSNLDLNRNGIVTFNEFQAWLKNDPDLVFDEYDTDKSGYLDEEELTQFLQLRQIPRLDHIIILLDPSFDGRVHYHRFQAFLKDGPPYIFDYYDNDRSGSLSSFEMSLLRKDLGGMLDKNSKLFARSDDEELLKQEYLQWVGTWISLLRDERNQLKVDNAIHATRPDNFIGPMRVVERRRAKYVAICRLTVDYLSTEGPSQEIEGDFEGSDALLDFAALAYGLFGLKEKQTIHLDDLLLNTDASFRSFISPEMLQQQGSYWNGRNWEARTAASVKFLYGNQCEIAAGTSDDGCIKQELVEGFETDASRSVF
uniref:Carbohydratebinding protein putative n=1 Tax=Albugo laibachii Nc14 TaxID=890382 RepID=F0W2Y6_9STRA|nr:carbohydratebinding protein putative [Albugo laibachii Nc14]|eukprot:CCA15423.1 carbohydratebinding protein putative [Albugo laibachii Nc14]